MPSINKLWHAYLGQKGVNLPTKDLMAAIIQGEDDILPSLIPLWMHVVLCEADHLLVQCSTSYFYALQMDLMYWYLAIVSLHETIFFGVTPFNNAFVFVLYGLYHMHGRKVYVIYIQVPKIHTWVILAHTRLCNGGVAISNADV